MLVNCSLTIINKWLISHIIDVPSQLILLCIRYLLYLYGFVFKYMYVPWDEIVSEHVNSESLASQLLITVSHLLRARVAGCEGMWWAEFKILNFLVLNTCEMMLPSLPLPHHHSPEPETEHMWCSSSDLLNTLNIYTKLHLCHQSYNSGYN